MSTRFEATRVCRNEALGTRFQKFLSSQKGQHCNLRTFSRNVTYGWIFYGPGAICMRIHYCHWSAAQRLVRHDVNVLFCTKAEELMLGKIPNFTSQHYMIQVRCLFDTYGWSSIWLTAGRILAVTRIRFVLRTLKLESPSQSNQHIMLIKYIFQAPKVPMSLALPLSAKSSMAAQVAG